MKRILFIILTVSVLLSVLVFSVSADVLDYNNYITDISVSDNDEIITLSFPSFGLWYTSSEDLSFHTYYEYSSSSSLTIAYNPLQNLTSNNTLLCSDFPDDTFYGIEFLCSTENIVHSAHVTLSQYDIDGNLVTYDYFEVPIEVTEIDPFNSLVSSYVSSISFDPSCYSFGLIYYFSISGAKSSVGGSTNDYVFWYHLTDPEFSFTFAIDSLFRQQTITNKQNAILGSIEDSLKDNGDKLDTIISGSVGSTPPPDSGVVDDLDDIEGALRDESQAGLDQGLGMQQSALEVFVQYAAAFGVVKLIFELFSGIPFFTYLLYISVAVGIFAVLLNLSFDIRNSFNRKQRRSKSG